MSNVFGTRNTAAPKLTAADKEARRELAVRKVLDGRTQADVADFLGVHPVTVAKWMRADRVGGDDAITANPTPGRPRFPTDDQEAEVRSWRLETPTDFGFRTDLGTAARVAQLIRDPPGVTFHPSGLREWPSKRGYSPRKPIRRADQRDPWPSTPGSARGIRRPKKVAAGKAHLVRIDATGSFLDPLVRRSGSPVGRTPVIGGDGGHRTKVSAIGAVTVSPVRRRSGFDFATAGDGDFSAEQVAAFLRDRLKHLRGTVVILWDGGSNHKGAAIREFRTRNKRLRLERLPAYAPDLNPVEPVWSWLKWGRLANFVPDDLDDWIVAYLVALKHDPKRLRALWERSERPFPQRPKKK